MRTSYILLFLVTAFSPAISFAIVPFDCSKAVHPVEKSLCSDPELVSLDRKLAELSEPLLAKMAEADRKKEQELTRAAMKKRYWCGAAKRKECLSALYETSIIQLQIKAGAVVASGPKVYKCGNLGAVTVSAYADAHRPAITLKRASGPEEIAFTQQGAQQNDVPATYTGATMKFTESESTAVLARKGMADVTCVSEEPQAMASMKAVKPTATTLEILTVAVKSYAKLKGVTGDPQFRHALEDLNEDFVKDAIVLLKGDAWCGAEGCTLVVFKRVNDEFFLVSDSSATSGPVRISPVSSKGWRSLIVHAKDSGDVSLEFDGNKYPANPGLLQRAPPEQVNGAVVVIGE